MNNPLPNLSTISPSIFPRHVAEIRKSILLENPCNSLCESMELCQLSHLLSLMSSGIYEVSTPNYSYKIAAWPEDERLLGGGLEDIAVNIATQIISTGIELLKNGNKKDMESLLAQKEAIEARIKIGEQFMTGDYHGSKKVTRKNFGFLCFCPVFTLMATGDGKFQTKELTYTGKFFNNMFHDMTGSATLHFGSKVVYKGNFENGNRNGYGTLEKQEGNGKFRVVFKGDWKDDKMHKGTYTMDDYSKVAVENGQMVGQSPELNIKVTLKTGEVLLKDTERNNENTEEVKDDEEQIPLKKEVNKGKNNKVVPVSNKKDDTTKSNKPNFEKKRSYFYETSQYQQSMQEESKKDYSKIREEKLRNPKMELTLEESIGLLIDCIRQGQTEAKKAHEKDVIIFIGNTGAGKSTMVNYLYGCKMQLQSGEELGIDVLEPVVTVLGKELMPIGHTKESKTFMPQVENDAANNFTYVDCPGFLDNRGPEINIANAVNIKNAIKESKSVKVCMLINYYSLKADRARGLSDMLKISSNLFGSSTNLVANKESILIGISSIPKTLDLQGLKKFLIADSPSEMQVLAERVFTFDPLEGKLKGGWSRAEIIKKIKSLTPITTHRKIFSTVLTNEDERKLLEISDDISTKIVNSLVKKNLTEEDFKLASKNLSFLLSLDIIEHISVYRLIDKNKKLIEKTLRDKHTEVLLQASFEKFDEAEQIVELLQKSIVYFDKSIQNSIDLDNLLQTIKGFREKKLNQEKKDQEFHDKIQSAENKAEETIKLLSEEKQKTEKQLQEHSLTIIKLLKDSEANMIKEMAKYDEEKKLLEKDYEMRLKKKEEEMHLNGKGNEEQIIQEMDELRNEFEEQKNHLSSQKVNYVEEQNKVIQDLRENLQNEKELFEKKRQQCIELEAQIKDKKGNSLILPEKTEGEKLCEEGKSYYFGTYQRPKDFDKALEFFKQSAKVANAEAFYWIGVMYEQGKSVSKNDKRAFKYFKESANLGYSWGFNKMGQFYQYGKGVEIDEDEALKMYNSACKKGCSDENLETRMREIQEIKLNKGVVESLLSQAQEHYNGSNYEEAVKLFYQAAKLGDCDAKYRVGEMYRNGKGVEENCSEAIRYFKMAEELNQGPACYELAEMYEKGEGVPIDEELAIKYYTKSIDLGCPLITKEKLEKLKQSFSNQIEGEKLFNQGSEILTQDANEAIKLYLQAGDLGHAKSLFSLGEIHYKGDSGIEKNYKKAFEFFKRAAELGHPNAYLMLVEFYFEGHGMRKDFKKALENYSKAKELGIKDKTDLEEKIKLNIENQKKGAVLLSQAEDYDMAQNGKETNYKKALELYMQAGNLGVADGFYYAACIHRFGNGVEKNWQEALKLYLKSGEMGNESGYFAVGHMYYEGECGQKNYGEALKYFFMAVEMRDIDSFEYIAKIYREGGVGVNKDEEKAKEYEQKALEAGY